MGAYPQIVDWNEDGLNDLIVGDTNGRITLFLNTRSNDDPYLKNEGFLEADGKPIDVGLRATPVVVDWNNDGKKDLVVGNEAYPGGYVRVYLNTGTNDAPVFGNYHFLTCNGSVISLYRASPEVCDLDRDGKKDLLVSEASGNIYFYKNTGTDAAPYFSSRTLLKANGTAISSQSSPRFDAADWDNDGDLDLLVGVWDAYVFLYRNTTITAIEERDTDIIPARFELKQNYPNPFNPETNISFSLPVPEQVTLNVYNTAGQLINTLTSKWLGAGNYIARWDGTNMAGKTVPSGTYIYRITAGRFTQAGKMVLLK